MQILCYRIMIFTFYCRVFREIFGHNRSRSQCFQVQPFTCWLLLVFFFNLRYILYMSLKRLVIFPKSWTSTGLLVTSGRFSPFQVIVLGCITMDLEVSYHPGCRGHLSPLSSTYVLIGHLSAKAKFKRKVWEQKIHHSKKIWEDLVESIKFGQLEKILFFILNLEGGMDVTLWLKHMHIYKI